MTKKTKMLSTQEKKHIEGLAIEVVNQDIDIKTQKNNLLNKGQRDYLEACVKSHWENLGAGSQVRPKPIQTTYDTASQFTLTHDWTQPADFNVYDSSWVSIAAVCCNTHKLSKPLFDLLLADLQTASDDINARFGDDYEYEVHLDNAKLSMLYIFAWLSRRGPQFDMSKAGKICVDRFGNMYHRTNLSSTSAYTAGHGSWAVVVSGVFNEYHTGNLDAVKLLG